LETIKKGEMKLRFDMFTFLMMRKKQPRNTAYPKLRKRGVHQPTDIGPILVGDNSNKGGEKTLSQTAITANRVTPSG
jgi:hypothetical protein